MVVKTEDLHSALNICGGFRSEDGGQTCYSKKSLTSLRDKQKLISGLSDPDKPRTMSSFLPFGRKEGN